MIIGDKCPRCGRQEPWLCLPCVEKERDKARASGRMIGRIEGLKEGRRQALSRLSDMLSEALGRPVQVKEVES